MIEVGSRWIEKHSGRRIVVLETEVFGTGPAWRYDTPTTEETARREENWHYSDVADFLIWNNFTRECE